MSSELTYLFPMDHADPKADLALILPRDLYYHALHTLRGRLPDPVSDRPEDLVRRDHAAIAQLASLLPANAEEVAIAVQFVAANAQAEECIRLMRLHEANIRVALQCNAQSANMMRQARGARALLLRVQAVRHKREANPGALEKAAWIEDSAIGLMADALADPPPPPPPPPTAPGGFVLPTPALEADCYAMVHPDRAALLRFLGGLPEAALPGFDPALHAPEPRVLDAILTGTSSILLNLLDRPRPSPA